MAANVSGEDNELITEIGDNENVNNHQETRDNTINQDNYQESLSNDGTSSAECSVKGLFGYSDLHAAASRGQANVLKSLLSDDSNINSVNGKTADGGYTPLHLAASAGHVDCIKELLDCNKVDIHVTDSFGRTPLETAEQNFKSDVAKLLRSHGKNFIHVCQY